MKSPSIEALRKINRDLTHVIRKAVYTAHAKATGGRDGRAISDDQILDVQLAVPKEMGGPGGGTNPEQLFAAGYSACFLGAMKFVANRDKLNISKDAYIEGDVGIGPIPTGFGIEVTLNIHLEGMDQEEAKNWWMLRILSVHTQMRPVIILM